MQWKHTIKYYTSFQNNCLNVHVAKWMQLKKIVLGERSKFWMKESNIGNNISYRHEKFCPRNRNIFYKNIQRRRCTLDALKWWLMKEGNGSGIWGLKGKIKQAGHFMHPGMVCTEPKHWFNSTNWTSIVMYPRVSKALWTRRWTRHYQPSEKNKQIHSIWSGKYPGYYESLDEGCLISPRNASSTRWVLDRIWRDKWEVIRLRQKERVS